MSLSAIVGTKELVLKALFNIQHRKKLKENGESLLLWLAFLDNTCLDKEYRTYALNVTFHVKNMLLLSAMEKTHI